MVNVQNDLIKLLPRTVGTLQLLSWYGDLGLTPATHPPIGQLTEVQFADERVEHIEEVGGQHDDESGDHGVNHHVPCPEVEQEGRFDCL